MAYLKREAVTVSFHSVERLREHDGELTTVPFLLEDLKNLYISLSNKAPLDLTSEETLTKVRLRREVDITQVEKISDRTITGTYRASYWGHAYDNSEKGKISAESINWRPFHFLIYLAESGRLYLGSQYLGLYGGYGALYQVVTRMLSGDRFEAKSYNLGGNAYANIMPKEIHVTVSNRNKSIAGGNVIGRTSVFVFKKTAKDDGFEQAVSSKISPFFGKSAGMVKAIAELSNDTKLLEISDEDIEDCKLIAMVNGNKKTINLLDESSFATRFPINVDMDPDGHPVYAPSRDQMIKLLGDEIIARRERG